MDIDEAALAEAAGRRLLSWAHAAGFTDVTATQTPPTEHPKTAGESGEIGEGRRFDLAFVDGCVDRVAQLVRGVSVVEIKGLTKRFERGNVVALQDIELAIEHVLEAGYRTPDIAEGTGGYVVTTSDFGEMICQAVTEIADMRHAYHAV